MRAPALLLVAASVIGGATCLAPAGPAGAASCSYKATYTVDSTKAVNSTCQRVQARIDRYIASYPTSYYGPQSATTSYVSSTSGVNAGNASRAEYGNVWSAWQYA